MTAKRTSTRLPRGLQLLTTNYDVQRRDGAGDDGWTRPRAFPRRQNDRARKRFLHASARSQLPGGAERGRRIGVSERLAVMRGRPVVAGEGRGWWADALFAARRPGVEASHRCVGPMARRERRHVGLGVDRLQTFRKEPTSTHWAALSSRPESRSSSGRHPTRSHYRRSPVRFQSLEPLRRGVALAIPTADHRWPKATAPLRGSVMVGQLVVTVMSRCSPSA